MDVDRADDMGLGEALLAERARVVALCARFSGSPQAAEDLAQETLAEAWRCRHRLYDPTGLRPWLAVIARHVCLRWQRARGQETRHMRENGPDGAPAVDLAETVPDEVDLEVELERQELAEMLDRALALLPEETRRLLLERYIQERSYADIADRLGVSEAAVAVRLHRGKLLLRRVLMTDLWEDAAPYGLAGASGGWETTRLWCRLCGQHRLLGRFTGDPAVLTLRCPGCSGSGSNLTECRLGAPRIKSYKAALARVDAWVDGHYGLNRRCDVPSCPRCGTATPIRVGAPVGLPRDLQTPGAHVYLRCEACGDISHSLLDGVVGALPEVRAFWRKNPRMHQLPIQDLIVDGRAAYQVRLRSLTNAAGLDVLVAREPLRLIAAHTTQES